MKDGIKKTDKGGNEFWRDNNHQYHRLNNLPAVIYKDGCKRWFVNGRRHRTNGPAVIDVNGDKYYVDKIIKRKPEQYTLWICNKVKQ